MPYKYFQPDVLQSGDVNEYLMNQSVMVFDNATARDAALTAPTEGMIVYLKDTNNLMVYTGTAWGGISATEVTADPAHADGGSVLRRWTGGSGFTGLTTANMTSNEYMMISNGTDTYVSGGAGGVTYLRAGNNDSANSVTVSSSGVQLNGVTRLGQSPNPYAWHVANQPVGTEMVIGAWGQSGLSFATINAWFTLGSVNVTVPSACSVMEVIYGFTIFVSGTGAFQVRAVYSGTGQSTTLQFFRNVTFDHFCVSGTMGVSCAPGVGTVSLQILGQGITLNGDANDSGYFTVHTV